MRLAALALGVLVVAGCGDPDPNVACAKHRGVAKVMQTGNNVNGVICRDGFYVRGSKWN